MTATAILIEIHAFSTSTKPPHSIEKYIVRIAIDKQPYTKQYACHSVFFYVSSVIPLGLTICGIGRAIGIGRRGISVAAAAAAAQLHQQQHHHQHLQQHPALSLAAAITRSAVNHNKAQFLSNIHF